MQGIGRDLPKYSDTSQFHCLQFKFDEKIDNCPAGCLTFCTCRDSITVMSWATCCSDHCVITLLIRTTSNLNCNWTPVNEMGLITRSSAAKGEKCCRGKLLDNMFIEWIWIMKIIPWILPIFLINYIEHNGLVQNIANPPNFKPIRISFLSLDCGGFKPPVCLKCHIACCASM